MSKKLPNDMEKAVAPELFADGEGVVSSEYSAKSALPEKASGKAPYKHTILIVDDERHVLKSLKRVFAGEDYKIITAEDASGALALMMNNKVTLIISDNRMPGMSGTDLLKIVRERYPKTIRIMLTGNSDTETVMKAVNDGAVYKFATKPWNDDDLRLTVRLALKQYDLVQENVKLKRISHEKQEQINRLRSFAGVDQTTLGSVLAARKLLAPGQLEIIVRYCEQKNAALIKAIVELGMIDELELIRIIQDESKIDLIVPGDMVLNEELSRLLPREVCEAGCFVPVRLENNSMHVAFADPMDLKQVDYIGFTTRYNVTPHLASLSEIENAIRRLYGDSHFETETRFDEIDAADDANEIDVLLDEEETETAEQILAKSSTPSAIKVVNAIISEAIGSGASDIHIEPKSTHSLIRYRIDGLLQDSLRIPMALHITSISRIKIMARMDISIRRIPQDGRITIRHHDKIVDIRVSSIPTIHGEKIVCRLLDKSAAIRSLDEIGVQGKSLERLKNIIKVPQGMVIATGPTGSGKTTTLYSLLQEHLSSSLNYVTIEDPVEYLLNEASQVHVHQKIGLTFASSLRATLRQDPDVILVGEIRDLETARAAFQAAMTGHMVFTTLHTNSTVATVSRLLNLGVEPYLIASAVQGIIAQRLVRRICPHCREKSSYDPDLLKILGISENEMPQQLYYGKGCERCGNSGYSGRVGLFEVFQMNHEFRHFLTENYRESTLLHMAKDIGMETLLDSGLEQVREGQTTLEEVLRVLGSAIEYEYNCGKCKARLDIRFTTCPYCGTPQRKICKGCQSRLEADWVACPYCGQNTISHEAIKDTKNI
jgi:type II secretory ATPase GspE/PulE/Tfp pilus assembly ATPase PilB-like protein/FixJ family two-component response regulator